MHPQRDAVITTTAIGPHTKTRRAKLACLPCHERKVKCDLQSRAGNPRTSDTCSNCETSGISCLPRLPKRVRERQRRAMQSGLLSQGTDMDLSSLMPFHESLGDIAASELSAKENQTLPQDYQWSTTSPNSNAKEPISAQMRSNSTDKTASNIAPGASVVHPSAVSPNHAEADSASSHGRTPSTYLGNAGFMPLFSQDRQINCNAPDPLSTVSLFDLPSPALQASFVETYLEYCYAWCPVLERDDYGHENILSQSALLKNALSLAASQIKPPVIKHASPRDYYNQFKLLFYGGQEKDPIACIKGIILLYWWTPFPPAIFSVDSIWWWTGIAIRMAQEAGLHRELNSDDPSQGTVSQGLRRRIWWTLYARERLTAMSQGRPCIINPKDCTIKEPTLADFAHPPDIKAQVFISWVQLCGTVGRVGQYLSRKGESQSLAGNLSHELVHWVNSRPPELDLAISTSHTTSFQGDVHQLHLPYLATIIMLHLSPSSNSIPKADAAAILAASCIARIFEDFLVRGSIRFLSAISCWYVAIALLPLVYARQAKDLTVAADENIKVLRIAIKELSGVYPGIEMLHHTFDRLTGSNGSVAEGFSNSLDTSSFSGHVIEGTTVDWRNYFPFLTSQTSSLASILLGNDLEPDYLDFEANDDMLILDDLYDFGNLMTTGVGQV